MLSNAKRIVIKVGSSLIIGEDNHVRKEWLASLAALGFEVLPLSGGQRPPFELLCERPDIRHLFAYELYFGRSRRPPQYGL